MEWLRPKQVSEPDADLMTVDQAVSLLGISYTILEQPQRFARIARLIIAAREKFEIDTNCLFVEREFVLTGSRPDQRSFYLPIHPVTDVDSIEYKNTDGDWVEMSSSLYEVEYDSLPAKICLKSNSSWPSDMMCCGSSVIRVNCLAGYDPDELPKVALVGHEMLLTHMHDNPAIVTTSNIKELPFAYQNIVWNLKIPEV